MQVNQASSELALSLAPFGRDATIAGALLTEAGLACEICRDPGELHAGMVDVPASCS